MRALFFALLACPLLIVYPQRAADADDHAVILIYHHVASDTPTSTSVTPERFSAHLAYLEANDFNVLPLPEILEALRARTPLPPDAVAITFDDAYLSVYNIARPMLDSRGWPYTVFVSTEFIDKGYGNYVSWEQLRRMAEQGATIANHGVKHQSALARLNSESHTEWLERVRRDAVQAQERISTEIGSVPTIYAWPYGEYNADVEAVIERLGWFAVGQQSGAAGYDSSMTAVPRYPMATRYASDDDFALRLKSEPLPVRITSAPERLLTAGSPPPVLQFALRDGPFSAARVNCYDSRGERLEIDFQARGESPRLSIRAAQYFGEGRHKYTCTAPHGEKSGVFGWYSHLWVVQNRL